MPWARSALMAMAFGGDLTCYYGRTWRRLYGIGLVNASGGAEKYEDG
jgi:hypothetical protein